jgi:hypothetical protein
MDHCDFYINLTASILGLFKKWTTVISILIWQRISKRDGSSRMTGGDQQGIGLVWIQNQRQMEGAHHAAPPPLICKRIGIWKKSLKFTMNFNVKCRVHPRPSFLKFWIRPSENLSVTASCHLDKSKTFKPGNKTSRWYSHAQETRSILTFSEHWYFSSNNWEYRWATLSHH